MFEEKTFKIKQYPLRGVNLKEIQNKKRPVCTCGHFEHLHGVNPTNCHDCLCPAYEYYMDMTFAENNKLDKSRKGDIST